MAGGFGGAIKLSGESEYKRALKNIEQQLKEVASEMKKTTAVFDANDQSTEALSAKARDLNNLLETQKSRLSNLKAQYDTLAPAVKDQADKHEALVAQYNNEKSKLTELENTLGKTSDEYKAQEKVVLDLADDVTKSTNANDANEKSLSILRTQMNYTEADIANTAKQMEKLGDETEDSAKKADESAKGGYTVLKNVIANLATQAITSALNGLKQLGQQFINMGKQAVDLYGQFEQLAGENGGVAKIFGKDSYQAVIDNASEAFKTVGVSANEYMTQVTGFSASLIQSLNGDTEQAVGIADRIMKDMADNANTYGTEMSSVQYAYQGFAKQNYTMLDNLKLGYGGTKKEMERLIEDASKMTEIQEQLGITVEAGSLSFANIANAISVVQANLGIMGTTEYEAMNTLQGSTRAMQSAWKNMLTGLADDNANFEQLIQDFIETLVPSNGDKGWVGNIVPRITAIVNGIGTVIQQLLPVIIQSLVPIINDNLPVILSAVQNALTAIIDTLPMLTNTIIALVPQLVQTLLNDLPQIIQAGLDMTLALIQGIVDAIPQLVAMLPEIINTIVNTLLTQDNLQKLIKAGIDIVGSLIVGIFQAFVGLGQAILNLGQKIHDGLQPIKDWSQEAGENLVKGIWNGISSAYTWLTNKIRGWVGNVTSFIKRMFGIHSPSTLFRDEIGENLALGIGEGFSEEMDDVSRMMADSIPQSFDIDPTLTGARYSNSAELDMVASFKEALAQMKIVLDDEVAGRFVERTVADAIYA